MKVECVSCGRPLTDRNSYGPGRHTECRKCFEKRVNAHKGSFYDAYMALLKEAERKG